MVHAPLVVDARTSSAELCALNRWLVARLLSTCAASQPLAQPVLDFAVSLHTHDRGSDGSLLLPLRTFVQRAAQTTTAAAAPCQGAVLEELGRVEWCVSASLDATLPCLGAGSDAFARHAHSSTSDAVAAACRCSTVLDAVYSLAIAAAAWCDSEGCPLFRMTADVHQHCDHSLLQYHERPHCCQSPHPF